MTWGYVFRTSNRVPKSPRDVEDLFEDVFETFCVTQEETWQLVQHHRLCGRLGYPSACCNFVGFCFSITCHSIYSMCKYGQTCALCP